MNFKLLSLVFGLAILGSLVSLYSSRRHKTQFPDFTLREIELYRNIDPDELHYRVSLFRDWANQNNKQYSAEEAAVRFRTWNKNYDIVQDHNSQNLTWTLEMNLFADLSSEEFASLYLGYNPELLNKQAEEEKVKILDESNLKDADWRKNGAVTPIRDQGQCGACYAFASCAALEGIRYIKQGQLEVLSPQQIIDCSSGNQGCNGGAMTYSYSYTKTNGIAPDRAYPYVGRKATCQRVSTVFKNSGYSNVASNNLAQLQSAVTNQPVSVAVEADQSVFQLYRSGTITGSACGTNLNHAITAVGFTTAGSYFIVKNSWGTSWGMQGYVQIGFGTSQEQRSGGVCGILMQSSYPTA